MTVIWADRALLPSGWARDVAVEIAADGRIATVRPGAAPAGLRRDCLLPAPANLHSHAFQRAMAGLTEHRGPDPTDSFWTWRALMFRFLDRLTPEDVEAIAAFVQMEMAEAGFGASVEFHYLHHAPGGVPYADPAEMSARIAAAAQASGLGLTLLPVQYEVGGCDLRPLGPGQARFGTTPESYAALLSAAAAALRGLPADTVLGTAPHSLRACRPEAIAGIAALSPGPVHMHLAEQQAEVEELCAHRGARPVDWALGHLPLGPRWCLIHCTQMAPEETSRLAATGAVAGLCPLTEASLGDGIFDGAGWQAAGGRLGLGSDSNIRITLSGELLALEAGQRLARRLRAPFATREKSSGRALFDAVCAGGAQAAGRAAGAIAPGLWADLLALDLSGPDLAERDGDRILDTWIWTAGDAAVADLWSAGRHIVESGAHVRRPAILAGYRRALARLRGAL